MIGFAVTERCPYCRKVLGTIAAAPPSTVLHSIYCASRRCRGRDKIVFEIRNGRARALTSEERAAMVDQATTI